MKKVALLLALLPSTLCAGSITNVTISGPGGTGTSAISLGFPEFGTLDFTALKPIYITFTVDGADNYQYEPIISNDTGATWTSFTFAGPGVVSGELPTALDTFVWIKPNSVTIYGDPLETLASLNNFPAHYESEFDFTTASAGTFTFEAFPNFVPEPSSWILMALGSMFVVIRFRNHRKETNPQWQSFIFLVG
jgi:PEP-CTERM motif